MKGRKIFFTILSLLVIGGCFWGEAKASKAATWDETKSITTTEGAFTYHAYLSQDGKECWIYRLAIKKEDETSKVLTFPKEINSAPVTKLGSKPIEESDMEINIIGTIVESYHGGTGYTEEVKEIEKICIPDTVTELTDFVFSGFQNVTEIDLPEGIKKLPRAAFYGCIELQKIEIPDGVETISAQTFGKCESLKNIAFGSRLEKFTQEYLEKTAFTTITISNNNPYLMTKKGAVYNKKGTQLYAILPAVKKVHIGKKVKSIADDVVITEKTITIAKKNKVFAKKGKCIYNKQNGRLLYYMTSKKDIVIAEGVTKVLDVKWGKNVKYSNTITLPKSLKKMDLGAINVLPDYLQKIEFKSKVSIKNGDVISKWSRLGKVKIVVPKKWKGYYTKQFAKCKKHCKVAIR